MNTTFRKTFIVSTLILSMIAVNVASAATKTPAKLKVTSPQFKNNKAISADAKGWVTLKWKFSSKQKKKIKGVFITLVDKNLSSPRKILDKVVTVPALSNVNISIPDPNGIHLYEFMVYGLSVDITEKDLLISDEEAFKAFVQGKVVSNGSIKGKTGVAATKTPPAMNTTTGNSNSGSGALNSSNSNSSGSTSKSMSFFVTSRGNNEGGGDYSGLEGADKMCNDFAKESSIPGAASKTWMAYMSNSEPRVNAIDRIGSGPWYNFKGKEITKSLLMGKGPIYADMLDEKGGTVEIKNEHDIVTGSDNSGQLAIIDGNPHTCNDWTDGTDDSATTVGHANWDSDDHNWQSQHTVSCSAQSFRDSAGVGRIFCFAKN